MATKFTYKFVPGGKLYDPTIELHADGKKSRVYIQVCGYDEFIITINYFDIRGHFAGAGFATSLAGAKEQAVAAYHKSLVEEAKEARRAARKAAAPKAPKPRKAA
ncbi:hypothetical protein K32_48540 [Kaistia sp. 32K]|uniref:hypothetical protein n=1 Tax=Kaistia sp. 32K TaxID=2795690 RepID=UPI0019155917|nr:hypothetical protein [Kaistia sp. 32K]BCP56237.1 hypothetical protein K32_48540 [Kaistia sp. 32K]